MAIVRVTKGFEFTGLSGDTKPTDNVPVYSTFMCTNNGNIYMYTYVNAGAGTKEWRLLLT